MDSVKGKIDIFGQTCKKVKETFPWLDREGGGEKK